MLLSQSQLYGILPDTVKMCLKVFFQELWAQNSKISVLVLSGNHEEEAFIEVTQRNELRVFPELFVNKDRKKSVLMYNKTALKHRRTQFSR